MSEVRQVQINKGYLEFTKKNNLNEIIGKNITIQISDSSNFLLHKI